MCVWYFAESTCVSQSTPDLPARAPSQNSATVCPRGLIVPMPVITTRVRPLPFLPLFMP